ncbi:MAG: hypothetical protein WCO56_28385 [Verrucomicrobiota bacterium]
MHKQTQQSVGGLGLAAFTALAAFLYNNHVHDIASDIHWEIRQRVELTEAMAQLYSPSNPHIAKVLYDNALTGERNSSATRAAIAAALKTNNAYAETFANTMNAFYSFLQHKGKEFPVRDLENVDKTERGKELKNLENQVDALVSTNVYYVSELEVPIIVYLFQQNPKRNSGNRTIANPQHPHETISVEPPAYLFVQLLSQKDSFPSLKAIYKAPLESLTKYCSDGTAQRQRKDIYEFCAGADGRSGDSNKVVTTSEVLSHLKYALRF